MLLSAALIRSQYVTLIGETATRKLELAGLLPVEQESRWGRPTDVTTPDGKARTMTWREQKRICTGWVDS